MKEHNCISPHTRAAVGSLARSIVLAAMVSAITACATDKVNPDGGRVQFPAGSVVVVNEDLRIYPGWARAFIQGGQVVKSADIDFFNDNCNVDIKGLSEEGAELVIGAGRYLTGTVTYMRAGDSMGRGMRRPGITAGVNVALSSADHPHVLALMCGYRADPRDAMTYYTLNRMQTTVGDLMSFEIAEPAN